MMMATIVMMMDGDGDYGDGDDGDGDDGGDIRK